MLRCGAQFAWDFSASEFDKLDLSNLNVFPFIFASLLKITLKKFYDTIFSRPRQPNKTEWRGNLAERRMNFGPRCENRSRPHRCDSTIFHSISFQKLKCRRTKPQKHIFRSVERTSVQRSPLREADDAFWLDPPKIASLEKNYKIKKVN